MLIIGEIEIWKNYYVLILIVVVKVLGCDFFSIKIWRIGEGRRIWFLDVVIG